MARNYKVEKLRDLQVPLLYILQCVLSQITIPLRSFAGETTFSVGSDYHLYQAHGLVTLTTFGPRVQYHSHIGLQPR